MMKDIIELEFDLDRSAPFEKQPLACMPIYRKLEGKPWTESDRDLFDKKIAENLASINKKYPVERDTIDESEYEQIQDERTEALHDVFESVYAACDVHWPERGVVPILKPLDRIEYPDGTVRAEDVFDRYGVSDEYEEWSFEKAKEQREAAGIDMSVFPVFGAVSEHGPVKGFFENEGKMRFDAFHCIDEHYVDMDRMSEQDMYLELFAMGESARVLRNVPDNISHRMRNDEKDVNYSRHIGKAANALRSAAVIINPEIASRDVNKPYEFEIEKMRSFNEPTLDEYEGIVLNQGRAIARMEGGNAAVNAFNERAKALQAHDLFEHQTMKNMPAYRAAQHGQWSQRDADLFESRTRDAIEALDAVCAYGGNYAKQYDDALLSIYSDVYQAECTDWPERGMFADIVNPALREYLGDGYADYKQWCTDVDRVMEGMDEPDDGLDVDRSILEARMERESREIMQQELREQEYAEQCYFGSK